MLIHTKPHESPLSHTMAPPQRPREREKGETPTPIHTKTHKPPLTHTKTHEPPFTHTTLPPQRPLEREERDERVREVWEWEGLESQIVKTENWGTREKKSMRERETKINNGIKTV